VLLVRLASSCGHYRGWEVTIAADRLPEFRSLEQPFLVHLTVADVRLFTEHSSDSPAWLRCSLCGSPW
jgi:hypothetical protein